MTPPAVSTLAKPPLANFCFPVLGPWDGRTQSGCPARIYRQRSLHCIDHDLDLAVMSLEASCPYDAGIRV
jgi:hypothetical protein